MGGDIGCRSEKVIEFKKKIMAHLIIKNVGPIKHVDIELNKVNIIMGPQSSGKSTINKIACYCSWVEKKVSLDQSFGFFEEENVFINELVRFHKLKGYIQPETYIEFESTIVKFKYSHQHGKPQFEWTDRFAYKRVKISYVSAERNMVAAIPNWFDVKFVDNNILSFMSDWGTARQLYSKELPLSTIIGDVKYYFDKSSNKDYVIVNSDTTLEFTDTSSGLQSIIPMNVLLDNMIYAFDKIDDISNFKRLQQKTELMELIYILKNFSSSRRRRVVGQIEFKNGFISEWKKFENDESEKEFNTIIDNLTNTKSCRFYIEEPEQNLFPSAQRDLLYYMVKAINSNDDHKLFITTHSPYILYALNNCMMGYLVKDKMPEAEKNEVSCRNSWINPELVSVWEIKDGELRTTAESRNNTIQGEDGLISDNYFDENMKEVMDDFYKMLNYYGDDKDRD